MHDIIFYYDVKSGECKDLILKTIEANGFAPEHNYDYFISYSSHEMKPMFAYFGDNIGAFVISWDDGSFELLSQPIAPKEKRAHVAIRVFNELFDNRKATKIRVELEKDLRKQILDNKSSGVDVGRIVDRFQTPMISIKDWDKELNGSQFSNLRKAKNRFFRNYKVEILKGDDVLGFGQMEFENLISEWKKNRKAADKAYSDDYMEFFKNKFKGSACHIALKLNDVLCGVAAAWVIPNTDDKNVYFAINLNNYSVQELGDFLTLIFLDELKDRGFEYLDFGSSDENLLSYKKKFGIHSQYETIVSYVKPKPVKGIESMDAAWKAIYESRARRDEMPDYRKSCWSKEGFEELMDLTIRFVDEIKSNDPSLTTVLDVGCGPGNYCDLLHKKGYDVTGIDYSHEMINAAKKNYPGIKFEQGNGYDIQFSDKSFDMIISIGALQCLVDYKKFLEELCRVAGKYIVISTLWREDDGKDPDEILKKQLMEDSWPTREYHSSEILPIMEANGFIPIKIVRNNPDTDKEIKDGYFIVAKRDKNISKLSP